jgi:hypothetical protein
LRIEGIEHSVVPWSFFRQEERHRRNDKFGSQKIKRSRSTGAPLDLGFDLKGAATDAMKKCASLLGVGLYLSRKPPPRSRLARVGLGNTGGGGMR